MIATILPGSTNFHAVDYNERKVAKGVAQLIEIKNFGALDRKGKSTPEELVEYLQSYSERNSKIQKAQFHVAISCKGHEMTEEQLLDFAHQYLKEMGYMEEGQPLLVYAHHDTDNTHLHIVTSRILLNDTSLKMRLSLIVLDTTLNRMETFYFFGRFFTILSKSLSKESISRLR